MKKIIIFTLTGQRDKVIDDILAEKLRGHGYEVHVHNFLNASRQSVPYLKPDVVIVPMVGGQFKLDFVQQCKEWGCTVIVRRGEAGASKEVFDKMDEDRKKITIGNWDYSDFVDLELVWGTEFACILVCEDKNTYDKLGVCGAFSFDPYFLPDCKKKDHDRKTILFATGWSCADGIPELVECGLPEDSAYQKVLYDRHREGRDIWIAAIKNAVRRFGNEWDFQLKVRPGERTDEYVQELGKTVKIYPQTYPAVEALKDCDVLVHSGSTMAIEAHLLGIPSFNFHSINPDGVLADVSPRLETYEALEFAIERARPGQSNINHGVLAELEHHLYGKIDGRACVRAAAFINEHIKDKEIHTVIPNTWPLIVKYEDDVEHISFKGSVGDDYEWHCPACRGRYFVANAVKMLKCPYCSMVIERTALKNAETEVLA